MDEGELAFVMTMRDEATREARAARAELEKIGGTTDSIEIPVDVRTKKARAEIRSLEAQIRKADLGMDVDVRVTKAARVRLKELKAELASLDKTADVNVHVRGAETLTEASRGVSTLMTAIVILGAPALAVLAGMTVILGGLTAGLIAAAGAGGALGLAIAPVVTGMVEGQKEVTKLNDKLDEQKQALEDARAATKATTKGSDEWKAALKKQQKAAADVTKTTRDLKREQAAFSKEYGPAAKGLERVQSAWKGFKAATRDSSLGVVGAALNLVADLLPKIAPLANAAAGGVRQLIGEFRQWARGPELAELLAFFRKEGPGAIVSFGHIVGNTLLGVLNLFRGFAPEIDSVVGGLEDMTSRFRTWSGGLDQNQAFQAFLEYARTTLPQVGRFLGQLILLVVRLAQAFAPFAGPILSGLTGILSALNSLPTPVIQAFGIAIGGVVLALKAWQLGVLAKATAERVATVATLAHTTATLAFGRTLAEGQTRAQMYGAKLGVAALGIGGVAAAAKEGGGAFSVLGGAASGAMAGAALGSFFPGPGTAIGGIIGGLGGLAAGLLSTGDNARKSGTDAASAIGSWQGYAATLDQVTGATTRATRAEALHNLQQSGVIPKLAAYGITARQAVDATVNGGRAQEVLNAKLNAAQGGYDKAAAGAQDYYRKLEAGDATRKKGDGDVTLAMLQGAKDRADAARKAAAAHREEGNAVRRQLGLAEQGIRKGREELAVIRTFSGAIRKLPKGVQTQLKAKILNEKDVVRLTSRYQLARKQVVTLIKENGGNPTKKTVDRVIASAKELTKTRAEAKLAAKNNASPVVARARRDLDNINGKTVTTYIDTVRRTKVAGARAAGGAIAAEKSYLVGERGPELVTFGARGYVHDAVKTARMIGDVTARAKGGNVRRRGGKGKKKGKAPRGLGVTAAMLDKDTVEQVDAALASLNSKLIAYYRARGRNAAQAKAASKATLKALRDETAAVRANAAARERVVAQINAAKAAGVAAAEAARQSLDVTSISTVNDAPVTAGFIVQGLQARVAALVKFQKDLAELRRRGVDKDLVGDLAQKGVDAAGAYAGALAAAAPEQLAAVNKAQKDIRAQAAKIGADTTAGLAVGLASQLAKIDAAGVRLANALLRAVRRRLGIKSPSRELYSDGINSVAGMVNSLRDATPDAEAAAAAMAARVQAAAVPTLGGLAQLANASSRLAPVVRTDSTIVIRHEVTSPDGSLDNLTAEQIADLIARSPRSAAALERALKPARRRATSHTITASDTPT